MDGLVVFNGFSLIFVRQPRFYGAPSLGIALVSPGNGYGFQDGFHAMPRAIRVLLPVGDDAYDP